MSLPVTHRGSRGPRQGKARQRRYNACCVERYVVLYVVQTLQSDDTKMLEAVKGALYRIWCGVNRLGDSGVKVV